MRPYLLLPIVASFGYAIASLALKRGFYYGIGPWRTIFVANVTAGILFLPLLLLGGQIPSLSTIYQPLVTGLGFFIGQIFVFRALAKGDASIVTPVLGLKSVIISVVLVVFFQENIRWTWWLASVLSVFAVGLLADRTPGRIKNGQSTALLTFLAVIFYSVTDVLVQRWAPNWGAGYFLPIMFGVVALLSFTLIPWFSQPLRQIPRDGWKWLLGGSVLLSLQALLVSYAIAVFGHATAVNIAYNCRGVWIVVLVWIVGHWFTSEEQHLGTAILVRRLLGAAILVAAIALI